MIMNEICHCGRPIYTYEDGYSRDLCQECSDVRCDAPVEGQRYDCLDVELKHEYIARLKADKCGVPSPGGGLLCDRPRGHEYGHIWEHRSWRTPKPKKDDED